MRGRASARRENSFPVDSERLPGPPHVMADADGGLRDLSELEILHGVECFQEPVRVRIDIQSSCIESKENLMRRLDGGKAPGGGLSLDDETAGRFGFDPETGQAHEGRTLPNDLPGAVPCRVDEENDEPAFTGCRGAETSIAYAHRVLARIQQNGVVSGIVDQRANPGVAVKAHSRDYLAIGQVQARESSGCAFLMTKLHWVHEEDDPRPRVHGRP